MSEITANDLTLVASAPAVTANEVIVLIMHDIGRVTFLEAFPPDLKVPRISVSLPLRSLEGLRDAITEALATHQTAKSAERAVDHAGLH